LRESLIMRDSQIKLGRNEACFCGSGNKYKKCCLSFEDKSLQDKLSFTENTRNKGLKQLTNRVKKEMGDKYSLLSGDFEIKMSEIILHLAEDLLEFATTKSQHTQAITVACVAWNLAVMFDSKKQKEELDKLLDKSVNDLQIQTDFSDIVHSIIQKKNYFYPNVHRIIVDYALTGNHNNLHLQVVSTLPESILIPSD